MIDLGIQKIFDIGISSKVPKSLHSRIRLTNQINAILMFFITSFTIMFIVRNDPTQSFGIASLVIGLLLFALMGSGFHVVVRSLTSTIPIFITTISHAAKVPADMPPIAGNYILTASLLVIPFIIFDPRERVRIRITTIINISLLLGLPLLSQFIDSTVNYEEVSKLSNQLVYFFVATFILVGSLVVLVGSNRREIINSREILKNLTQSKEESEKAKADLEASLVALEKAKQEDLNRNWITEGIGKFGEMMRIHSEEDNFYDRLAAEIAKYVDLNQVALFLLHKEEGHEPYLQLESCYAFNRKKFIDKKISIGEGLTGQAVRDRDKIFLTEIPEGYTSIQSGLGEGTPKCVLIMPMIVNDVVEGVLEVASFNLIEAYQIEFIQRLSENIASIVNAKNVNIRTRALLESSQKKTQELQQKEEEMRQNMEEMIASQEDQKRREQELQQRIAELEERLAAMEPKAQ